MMYIHQLEELLFPFCLFMETGSHMKLMDMTEAATGLTSSVKLET